MENNQEYTFKGVIFIGSSPFVYTAKGLFKPGYKVQIDELSLCLRVANEADMNSPGIQEVNEHVLSILTNSSEYKPISAHA